MKLHDEFATILYTSREHGRVSLGVTPNSRAVHLNALALADVLGVSLSGSALLLCRVVVLKVTAPRQTFAFLPPPDFQRCYIMRTTGKADGSLGAAIIGKGGEYHIPPISLARLGLLPPDDGVLALDVLLLPRTSLANYELSVDEREDLS